MSAFTGLIARDLKLAVRSGGGGLLAAAFFVITVTMIPFGVGPETRLLARIAGGVVWVAALLSVLLSLDRLFQADYEDGSLDMLALSPLPMEAVVLAKCIAHWLTTSLPLICVAPVLAIIMNMPAAGFGPLIITMIVGTPALTLIGAIGAALTVGLRRGGLILSLLILPLYVPVLIFAALGVEAALTAQSYGPHLMILGGVTLGTLVISPIASAAALKLNLG